MCEDVIRIRTEIENTLKHTVSQLYKEALCSGFCLETEGARKNVEYTFHIIQARYVMKNKGLKKCY